MGSFQWTSNSGGNWADAHWNGFVYSAATAGPSGAGKIANFLGNNTGANAISLNTSATLGTLNFSSANAYTITATASNTLTFDNGGAGAVLADWQGSHTINAPIVLNDNLTANVATVTDTLTLGQQITGAFGLTKTGAGNLLFNGAVSYAGTTSVQQGTLTVGASGSLGGGAISIASGATLQINGALTTVSSINNAGTFNLASASGTGNLTNSGTATIWACASLGSITNTGMLTLQGSATTGALANAGLVNFGYASFSLAELSGAGNCTLANTTLAIGSDNVSTVYSGNLVQNVNTSANLIKTGIGQLTLAGSNNYTGGTTVNAGLLTLASVSALPSTGAVTLNAGAMSLAANAANPLPSSAGHNALLVPSLTIAGTTTAPLAVLALNNNDAILRGGYTITDVRNLLASGYNNGAWSGNGITAASNSSANHMALGYMTGSNYLALHPDATFDGVAVLPTDILLKYTYVGDFNFAGQITAADYAQLDASYLLHPTSGNTWMSGDLNYDGQITATDYALIDAAYSAQSPQLAAAMIAQHTIVYGDAYTQALAELTLSTVPEPASLSLLVLAAPLLWRRRR
jgi:autotransporter-associated beta strand protein